MFADPYVIKETRKTVARSRDELKEDKKARKAAVKQEKQARRVERAAGDPCFLPSWLPRLSIDA